MNEEPGFSLSLPEIRSERAWNRDVCILFGQIRTVLDAREATFMRAIQDEHDVRMKAKRDALKTAADDLRKLAKQIERQFLAAIDKT